MRLTVFNGSPRGRRGNTEILLKQILDGFEAAGDNSYEIHHLKRTKEMAHFVQAFAEAEAVLLAFPLYTDAMPGLVKAFIDELVPFCGRGHNPALGFLVQSGFPEATHSRHVEVYLEKLAARLDSRYLGTIVKGGCEGVRSMPERMNAKLFASLYRVGQTLGESGQFDQDQLSTLAKPERYPRVLAPVFQVLLKAGMGRAYWDGQLKKNGAYEQRFARPYAP